MRGVKMWHICQPSVDSLGSTAKSHYQFLFHSPPDKWSFQESQRSGEPHRREAAVPQAQISQGSSQPDCYAEVATLSNTAGYLCCWVRSTLKASQASHQDEHLKKKKKKNLRLSPIDRHEDCGEKHPDPKPCGDSREEIRRMRRTRRTAGKPKKKCDKIATSTISIHVAIMIYHAHLTKVSVWTNMSEQLSQ